MGSSNSVLFTFTGWFIYVKAEIINSFQVEAISLKVPSNLSFSSNLDRMKMPKIVQYLPKSSKIFQIIDPPRQTNSIISITTSCSTIMQFPINLLQLAKLPQWSHQQFRKVTLDSLKTWNAETCNLWWYLVTFRLSYRHNYRLDCFCHCPNRNNLTCKSPSK